MQPPVKPQWVIAIFSALSLTLSLYLSLSSRCNSENGSSFCRWAFPATNIRFLAGRSAAMATKDVPSLEMSRAPVSSSDINPSARSHRKFRSVSAGRRPSNSSRLRRGVGSSRNKNPSNLAAAIFLEVIYGWGQRQNRTSRHSSPPTEWEPWEPSLKWSVVRMSEPSGVVLGSKTGPGPGPAHLRFSRTTERSLASPANHQSIRFRNGD